MVIVIMVIGNSLPNYSERARERECERERNGRSESERKRKRQRETQRDEDTDTHKKMIDDGRERKDREKGRQTDPPKPARSGRCIGASRPRTISTT